MMRRSSRFTAGRLALLLAAGGFLAALTGRSVPAAQAPQAPVPTLDAAHKLFEEKSYADALQAYERLLQEGKVPAGERDLVEYRVAVSLGKSEQWDRALTAGLDFVKARRNTVWEPRGLYWLGRLYAAVPHVGFRVGDRIQRGTNTPQGRSGAGEQVHLQEQDFHNALDALEAARVYYPRYRRASRTQAEEIQLNFDLARTLTLDTGLHEWLAKREWAPPADPTWKIDPAAEYSPDWAPPKKQRHLFEQVRFLASAGESGAGPHQAALSLFGEAMWLRNYQQLMRGAAVRTEDGKNVRIPYPYEDDQPVELFRRLVREFPEDTVRDQAQFTVATFLENEQKFVEAVAELRRLLEERPQRKWTEDARHRLEQIQRKQLSLHTSSAQKPGEPVKLGIHSRNVKQVRVQVYRVRPEEALARTGSLDDPQRRLAQFTDFFESFERAQQHFGARVLERELETKDAGDYKAVNDSLELPLAEPGAYAVTATAGGAHAAALVFVSEVVLVQKVHRDGALFFATDFKTGAPVRDAEVIAKQWWWQGENRSAVTRGKTDASGLLNVPFQRAQGRQNFSMAALAFKTGSYARTDQTHTYDRGDNPDTFQVYSVTDRSVYRPLQTVHYRQVLMRRQGGQFRPVANRKVEVRVNNPRGEIIHSVTRDTGEFGSVNGEFYVPEDAPLGEYYINVSVPGEAQGPTAFGGNRFRVEEYKKPEFEVEVDAPAERVRLGERVTATVKASYYFGGPVPNAHVSYRVYRNYYRQYHQFPRPFDFLYRHDGAGDYNTYYRNGEVVTQGEARTDEKGEAKISFDSGGEGSRWKDADFRYTVEADVQDASRRVISGSGDVKATRHDVAVFLDFPRGYAGKGDQLQVEIRTLNPSDKPVSVAGKAQVWRRPDTVDGKETLVHEEPQKTDAEGRGYLKWTATEAGYFRVAFVTRDSAEQEVTGSTYVWVEGPELRNGRFHFQSVLLQSKELYYQPGQTARVLLVTPEPDCTVLVTRDAGNEIVERRVVRVPGRSLELELPVTERDSPNVHLAAVLIRDGRPYQALSELFVPPARQMLKVAVTADRERYEPGQKARFRLQARDWQDRPVRTELSISVADAALAYIQKDYAPDVRQFFYGQRRPRSLHDVNSVYTQIGGLAENTEPHGTYQVHEWLLPEGMGQLEDWPGDQRNQYRRYVYYGFNYFGRRGGMAGFGGGFAEERYSFFARDLDTAASAPGPAGPAGLAAAPAAKQMAQTATRLSSVSGMALGDRRERNAAPAARTNFSDLAFWSPAVVTDAQGNASVEVTWPDNLTRWRANAVGHTVTAQVGGGSTQVTTKKDLLVRLQAPRFFVERDQVVLSANVHNYTPQAQRVRVKLDLQGETAELNGGLASEKGAEQWLEIPKEGERRVDWTLRVVREGNLRVRMAAQGRGVSDAMEMAFPVLVHGVERQLARSGVMRQEKEAQLAIELPKARKPGSSELVVQLNPSLGAVMLDAIPYLIDYPYGCIEQTMSRFMPAVVVAKTLKDLGYDLEALSERARLLDEKQRQGDAARPGGKSVANSAYSYPKGRPGTIRVDHLSRFQRRHHSPVFDSEQLDRIVAEGLARVRSWQRPDGGWGWWPGDSSDPYMTTYVLHGLITARDAGYQPGEAMLERGLTYLRGRFLEDDNFHRMAYEVRVLAMEPRFRNAVRPLATGRLFENRERLSAYSKALLATALHLLGDGEKAEVLLRNLESTAQVDGANGTASWRPVDRLWWCWYNHDVETNAAVLEAFTTIRPQDRIPPMLVKWLVNNRRGNSWYSTKDTAMAVYALAGYVRTSKELSPEYTLTVDLGGRVKREYTVTRENALFFDNQFIVPDELLETGKQSLKLTKNGPGALYYSAYTRYFSLEEPIKATGNEIFVQRRYFRLKTGTASGAPVTKPIDPKRPNPFLTGQYELLTQGGEVAAYRSLEDGPRYERTLLREGETLESGDLLEVELQLESKNDYEYLVFEDMKPAGCEAVSVRSGPRYSAGLYSYVELRDQKSAFFLPRLPQGKRTLTYRLRAEIPGRFHVLPTNGYAMYAPDLRTLSDEITLPVKDREK